MAQLFGKLAKLQTEQFHNQVLGIAIFVYF